MNGKVKSLWRYPVKSMMGEEINASVITKKGLVGDRAYGVIDHASGKLANAKNPLKWPNMFQYRAMFIEPPQRKKQLLPVRITLPNGTMVESTDEQIDQLLSDSFQRKVTLETPTEPIQFEGYIPKNIKELENRGTIFTRTSPEGTFFDIGIIHIITTSTINTLRKLAPESRIEPRRFRPNLIIDVHDAEGFIENKWIDRTIQIGDDVTLRIVQGTKRCVMTTLAQGDLPNDPDVLRQIVKNNDGTFGVYASVIQEGEVKINDPITVL